MSGALKKVVLAGASGTFGGPILDALLKTGLTVTILTRSSSSATFDTVHNIHKIIKVDYTLASLTEALEGQDALVSAVGVAGIPGQDVMIDAAVDAGVKRFVISDFGYAPEQKRLPELDFTRTGRNKIFEYLQSKVAANPGLTWTAIAIGPPIDMALQRFPKAFGFDMTTRQARIYDGGNQPFTATTLSGIGQSVVGVLEHPTETKNRYVRVYSVKTTQNEILAAYENLTGEKWHVTDVDCQELLIDIRARFAAGVRSAVADGIAVQLFEKDDQRPMVVKVDDSDNVLLGIQQESLRTIVETVLHDV